MGKRDSHHCTDKQVKRQLSIVNVLLLCVFYGLNTCLQAWQQTYLPAYISFLVIISKKILVVLFGCFIHVCNTFCLFSTSHPFLPPLPWVSTPLLPMSPFQRCLIFSWAHAPLFLIIIGSHGEPPFTRKRSFSYYCWEQQLSVGIIIKG